MIDLQKILTAVNEDSTLSDQERQLVAEQLKDEKFKAGLVGGGLALLWSKYKKLSKSTQVLVTLAGYGIGRALANRVDTNYNKKTKTYEIRP